MIAAQAAGRFVRNHRSMAPAAPPASVPEGLVDLLLLAPAPVRPDRVAAGRRLVEEGALPSALALAEALLVEHSRPRA